MIKFLKDMICKKKIIHKYGEKKRTTRRSFILGEEIVEKCEHCGHKRYSWESYDCNKF